MSEPTPEFNRLVNIALGAVDQGLNLVLSLQLQEQSANPSSVPEHLNLLGDERLATKRHLVFRSAVLMTALANVITSLEYLASHPQGPKYNHALPAVKNRYDARSVEIVGMLMSFVDEQFMDKLDSLIPPGSEN